MSELSLREAGFLNCNLEIKPKLLEAHMKAAEAYAECSTAVRLKVGCVIVKDNRIISIGYNGTPSGWTNECEEETLWLNGKQMPSPVMVTKPEVLHAESNAIAKLARSNESGHGSIAIITHSPCLECAKLLFQSGIVGVYYRHDYRSEVGKAFLEACHVKVQQI